MKKSAIIWTLLILSFSNIYCHEKDLFEVRNKIALNYVEIFEKVTDPRVGNLKGIEFWITYGKVRAYEECIKIIDDYEMQEYMKSDKNNPYDDGIGRP